MGGVPPSVSGLGPAVLPSNSLGLAAPQSPLSSQGPLSGRRE